MNLTLSLTILLLPTSTLPILSQFQQSNAISYLIHTKGHDILGNASLLKEMRAFPNVSNQGSCLKFNVVALNIEYREETISKSMLSRPEPVAILSAHYRQAQVLRLFLGYCGLFAVTSCLRWHVNKKHSSPSSLVSCVYLNIQIVHMTANGDLKKTPQLNPSGVYLERSLPSQSEHCYH